MLQILLLTCTLLVINSDPIFERARENNCDTTKKMECSKHVCQCQCENKSECVWSRTSNIHGCKCEASETHNYSFIEQAKEFGCDDSKFECQGAFCNCKCLDGSQCLFTPEGKSIMGCPCNVKKYWDAPQPLPRDELKQRRIDRKIKRQQKRENRKQEQQIEDQENDL